VTHEHRAFSWLLLASLAVHALAMALLAVAPGGSGHGTSVQIYTVQIVEAPAPPEVRVLTLEPPTNQSALAPAAAPPPLRQLGAPPSLPAAPKRAPALPLPKAEGEIQVAPGVPKAGLLPPPSAATPYPEPPALPAPNAAQAERAPAEAARSKAAPELPAPAPRPMERLKSKVEQLKLQVEPAPTARREADQSDSKSLLALRLFHNAVRERVQPNYSFPGTFPPTLKARVRVVLGRDGAQRATELIESSGDSRFDTLVCLAAIRRSRLPPLPAAVEGDTLTLTLTCSP
jgi:hypothetical protein